MSDQMGEIFEWKRFYVCCPVHPKRNDAAAEREKKIAGNNGYNGLNGSFVNCELLQEKRTYNNKKRFIEKETEERRPKKWTQLH